MRATMSWSYQLLDGAQQTLFRRLGVFPDSFCLDAAEKVCTGIGPDGDWFAPDALLNGIAALVDLHLVEPITDVGSSSVSWGGYPEDARFAMTGHPGPTRWNCSKCPARTLPSEAACTTGPSTSPGRPSGASPRRMNDAG